MLALAAAALLWSGNFIAGRALREDIDPLALNLLRWTLCLALFAPWVGAKAWRSRRVVAREWRLLLALGATGIAGFHSLTYLALASTSAINALLMLSLTPSAILVGAALAGGAPPTRTQWAGTFVSLLGAGVLLTRGNPTLLLDLAARRGDLWMLAAVPLWAVYSLLLRRRPADLPPDVALAASIVPALALLLPAALLTMSAAPVLSPRTLGALAYIAVFASLIAFLLWSHGVDVLGPERAGPFVHLMPVFGTVLAVVMLGERVEPAQWAGGLCVLAGIALGQRSPAFTSPGRALPRPAQADRSHHRVDAAASSECARAAPAGRTRSTTSHIRAPALVHPETASSSRRNHGTGSRAPEIAIPSGHGSPDNEHD
jgi:drug/metabolite transporter (DMT)-like permease